MIEAIRLSNVRGIASGAVSGLRRLTVLVGPNGSGKSTILDGLLVGAHPVPGDAVGRVVRRRGDVDAARWLFHGGQEDGSLQVEVEVSGTTTATQLRRTDDTSSRLELRLERQGGSPPYIALEGAWGEGWANGFEVVVDREGRYAYDDPGGRPVVRSLRLIDSLLTFRSNPLASDYQRVRTAGNDESIHELVRQLIPGARGIELAADSRGMATLHVTMATGTLALGAAGDGVRLAIRLAIDLAASRSGLVLLEEPEAHLHPAALGRVALTVVDAVERGLQLVVATHSLELIDELLDASSGRLPVEDVAIVRVNRLEDATLIADTLSGEAALRARRLLHEDVR